MTPILFWLGICSYFSLFLRNFGDYLLDITNIRDKKNERKPQPQDSSNSIRKHNVDIWRQDVPKERNLVMKGNGELRSQEVPKARTSKPKDVPRSPMPERHSAKATTCRNVEQRQKTQEKSGDHRRQEIAPKAPKPIDIPRKASTPHDISTNRVPGRPPLSRGTTPHRNTQQRQKPSGVSAKPCAAKKDVSIKNVVILQKMIATSSLICLF